MENGKNGAQIVYFSHGGGPLPLLGDPSHKAMNRFMKELSGKLRRPEAILVVSAHWEMPEATVLAGEQPSMLFDYFGFPEESYAIKYPAPGHPGLAKKVAALLEAAGMPSRSDSLRGYDHGVFIPLMMMYPEADIPVCQLSLLHSLDPAAHLALGKALQGLKDEPILVIGSGFSFHNMRAFDMAAHPTPDARNDAFQDWLIDTCAANMAWEERGERLKRWEAAPNARFCHPREEHLLPLHVCAAMAEGKGTLIFDDYIAGKRATAFLWG